MTTVRPLPPAPMRQPPPTTAAPAARTAKRLIEPRAIAPVAPWLVLNAVEGFGKTTFGAYSPAPLILMARGETGYDTLLAAGRVPQVPAYVVETWEDALGWLDQLIEDPQDRKTLVLDATGGYERLCHEYVCRTKFQNKWGDDGFMSFHKGYDVAVSEWVLLLNRIERLKSERHMGIVMLGHSKVASFKNPIGADFDRYTGDVHAKTWGPTAKCADAVLFGNFFTVVDKEKQGKGKGIGGTDRVIYTERRDAWDAKNRYGMAPEIWLTDIPPQEMWNTVYAEIVRKK